MAFLFLLSFFFRLHDCLSLSPFYWSSLLSSAYSYSPVASPSPSPPPPPPFFSPRHPLLMSSPRLPPRLPPTSPLPPSPPTPPPPLLFFFLLFYCCGVCFFFFCFPLLCPSGCLSLCFYRLLLRVVLDLILVSPLSFSFSRCPHGRGFFSSALRWLPLYYEAKIHRSVAAECQRTRWAVNPPTAQREGEHFDSVRQYSGVAAGLIRLAPTT